MGESGQLVSWLFFVLHTLILLVAIGVSLGLVRRASARGAYLLSAAAGVQLLLSCCVRASFFAARESELPMDSVDAALTCVSLIGKVTTVGLLAFAFVTLASAVGARANGNSGG